jgi:hypothetical protein
VARVSAEDAEIVERGLVSVLNAVLVADSVDVGDLGAVQRALGTARDTLALGLEHVSKGDEAAGALLLVACSLKRVFQVGVSLALRLKFRADRLMKSPPAVLPGSRQEPLLDGPLDAVVGGLRQKRPRYAEALDDPRAPPERLRAFRDRADVQRVAQALEGAERLAQVLEKLGFEAKAAAAAALAARPSEMLSLLRFSDFFLTAIARELVGEGFAFRALPAQRLEAFAAKAFVSREGKPAISEELRALATAKLREAGASISAEHEKAAMELATLALGRLVDEAGEAWAQGTLAPDVALPLLVER